MSIIERRSNGKSFFMGGCGIVSRSDRVIKVCVATVSSIAGTNELVIVTGTIMSDGLIA